MDQAIFHQSVVILSEERISQILFRSLEKKL